MTSDKRHEKRIVDGTTWNDLLDRLRQAGQLMQREGAPQSPLERAEGYRYLTRVLRLAFMTFVEHGDPRMPVLHRFVDEITKMGADDPDRHDLAAAIASEAEYRIWGRRGSAFELSFATLIGPYGKGFALSPSGLLDGSELELAPDGSFEILVSERKPARAANWLPMKKTSGTLIVRQLRRDPEREELAELHIEPVGGATPSSMGASAIDEGITQAANFVEGAATMFANWTERFRAHTNELPPFDARLSIAGGADPSIVHHHSYWQLEADEALVIDAVLPQCDHWSFSLNDHWMESLDYRYFRVHISATSAVYREDGSVRIVVAHVDPRVPNWIQTAGHVRGTMCWRWLRAKEASTPRTRVVKVADVGEVS